MKGDLSDPLATGVAGPQAPSLPRELPPAAPPPSVAKAGSLLDQKKKETSPAQEVDYWLGSYSGWTMLPSWLVCLVLTGLIVWGAWPSLPRGWVQLAVFSLAGAVWLVQVIRWSYRLFGYNYRLTHRRLFQSKGFLYNGRVELELASVAHVLVKRNSLERLLRDGRVCVFSQEQSQAPLVLEGIGQPQQLADEIRELARQAREQYITHTSVEVPALSNCNRCGER